MARPENLRRGKIGQRNSPGLPCQRAALAPRANPGYRPAAGGGVEIGNRAVKRAPRPGSLAAVSVPP